MAKVQIPDYSDLGLDKYQNALLSPSRGSTTLGMQFDIGNEVQGKKARISVTGFGGTNNKNTNFIALSGAAMAAGSVTTGNSVTVTFTLTPNAPFLNSMNFALPFISVYGTTSAIAAWQIYPVYGANIANSKFAISSGFDYASYTGTNSVYKITIENNSGSTYQLYAIGQWKFVNYNFGTGVSQ